MRPYDYMVYFHESRYPPGLTFSFQHPTPSEWKIVSKKSEQLCRLNKHEAAQAARAPQSCYTPSYVIGTFLVQNVIDAREGFLRIHAQVPDIGFDYASREERAKGAVSLADSMQMEVEAMISFHEQGSTITPALLGFKEDIQDNDGFIPGGYITHMVLERIPGTLLAEDNVLHEWRGNPHPFYREFDRAKRDEIRECLVRNWSKLVELGYHPFYVFANKLVWDDDAGKLYFVDFRQAHKISKTDITDSDSGWNARAREVDPVLRHKMNIWRIWGLAYTPRDRHIEDFNIQEWIL